jgi:tetratricopeptide (TPR) repeat protein
MNFWDTLGIKPTDDSRAIKRAYARLLRKYNPENDPGGFMCLREAYESACAMADSERLKAIAAQRKAAAGASDMCAAEDLDSAPAESGAQTPDSAAKPKPPAREAVPRALENLYDDFSARISVDSWRVLFASFSLEETGVMYAIAAQFFNERPCLPRAVWLFLNNELELTENPSFCWARLLAGKPDLCGDLAEAFAFDPSHDYAAYAELRLKAYLALRAGAPLAALRYAGEAVALLPRNTALLLLVTGDSFYALGMPREAAEAYALYLEQCPFDDAARFNMADALTQAGAYAAALTEFQSLEARGYRPDDVRGKIRFCMTKIGKVTRVRAACKRFLRRIGKPFAKLARALFGAIPAP